MTRIYYCRIGLDNIEFFLILDEKINTPAIPNLEKLIGIFFSLPDKSIKHLTFQYFKSNSIDKIDLNDFSINYFRSYIEEKIINEYPHLPTSVLQTILITEPSSSELQFMQYKNKFEGLKNVKFEELSCDLRDAVHLLMRDSPVKVVEK